MSEGSPRIRTANKFKPPFALNKFPKSLGLNIGGALVYILATKGRPDLEGNEWEEIFAKSIGADWKNSVLGLDDVVLGSCAWGAKTVKGKISSKRVRLISGRNSLEYSYKVKNLETFTTNEIGKMVLSIWNKRFNDASKEYKHLRTVVMVKSQDLLEVLVFEFLTVGYKPENYNWKWNGRGVLEGFDTTTNQHKFSWQPTGTQFTIIETVPKQGLIIKIKKPKKLNREKVLKELGFNEKWVTVTRVG